MSAFTDVSKALFRNGAYTVNTERPPIYVSGKIGPIYVDCSMLQQDPDDLRMVTGYMADLIKAVESPPLLDRAKVTGGETRDLPFSIPTADRLRRPHLIIRKEQKGYGMGGSYAGGTIKQGDYVIHVADLLTAGTSAKNWIDAIKGSGGEIELYLVVFDRMQGGTEDLRRMGTTSLSLVQMDDRFFNVGVDKGFVTPESHASVQAYLQNPDKWAVEYLRTHPEFVRGNIAVNPDGKVNAGKKGLAMFGDKAYPQLREEFTPQVKQWLEELGCTQPVPEFGYRV